MRLLRPAFIFLFALALLSSTAKASEGIHLVKRGETLTSIAGRYGISVESLRRQNGIKGSKIHMGQKLRLVLSGTLTKKPSSRAKRSGAEGSDALRAHTKNKISRLQQSPALASARNDQGPPQFRFLTPAFLREIGAPHVVKGRWKYIVLHHSGTPSGNAKIFEYYHRNVRHMENGLAYHFVIGNGHDSGDGEIEVGNRWRRQLKGGHVRNEALNPISIGICFVGNFNEHRPSPKQMAAAIELITWLRERCGPPYPKVFGHHEMHTRGTQCPGSEFPLDTFHRLFNE